MKSKKIIIATVSTIVAIAILWFCFGGKSKSANYVIETAQAVRGDVSEAVTATGTIEPVTQVEVGTQVSGIIDKLYADYNSIVTKGQLIAEMDKVTLQSELTSQQATYDGAKAEYEYQKKNYERSKGLHEKSLISDTDFEQALYNYQKAKSSYDSSKASLAKAERNLAYATITSPIDGIVTSKDVEEGQTVRRGQVLFIIDQVPYLAALRTAEANVEAARAGVATSQLTYDSKKELYAQKVISEFDLKTSYNSLLTAKAQLAQAEAQQVNAANNLSYTEVKSPADGMVGTLPYRVGTLVSASLPKPLTTVSDNSNMYVYFSMTENQLLDLTRRYGSKDKALAEMDSIELQLNDRSVYPQEGKIETISGVIDTSTGTVSLRAVFPNKEGLLTSGGSGNVIIPVRKENCIVVPQSATYEVQDKVYVYKVVDGKAQSVPVQVTRVNGGQEYIVESGLKVGDTIVAEGVGLLREGTSVQPKTNE